MEKYSARIVRCLHLLGDEGIWWRPNEASNAAGNIVRHLCGNVSQCIDAGLAARRMRDEEMLNLRSVVKSREASWSACSNQRLNRRDASWSSRTTKLYRTFSIQGYTVSEMTAIGRVCETLRLSQRPDHLAHETEAGQGSWIHDASPQGNEL